MKGEPWTLRCCARTQSNYTEGRNSLLKGENSYLLRWKEDVELSYDKMSWHEYNAHPLALSQCLSFAAAQDVNRWKHFRSRWACPPCVTPFTSHRCPCAVEHDFHCFRTLHGNRAGLLSDCGCSIALCSQLKGVPSKPTAILTWKMSQRGIVWRSSVNNYFPSQPFN